MVILIEVALSLKLTVINISLWRRGIDIISIKKMFIYLAVPSPSCGM